LRQETEKEKQRGRDTGRGRGKERKRERSGYAWGDEAVDMGSIGSEQLFGEDPDLDLEQRAEVVFLFFFLYIFEVRGEHRYLIDSARN